MEPFEAQNNRQIRTGDRIAYWDIAKAVAIFCVVWGHCLQNMTSDTNYWLTDTLCKFIYAFHMPLFMIISGYFAYSSLFKPITKTIKKKIIQLLVPSVAWYLVISGFAMIFHREFNIGRFTDIAGALPYSLWFLKSLFMCYLITLVGVGLYRWRRWSIAVYAVMIFGVGEWLNYVSTISMLPFFIAGILLHTHKEYLCKKSVIGIGGILLIFISMLTLWEGSDYNMYMNPFYHNWGGYKAMIIRCLIGLSGICVVLYGVSLLERYNARSLNEYLQKIGSMTLGIYCIQVIIAEGLLKHSSGYIEQIDLLKSSEFKYVVYNYIITPIASILTIWICVAIIKLLKKNRFTRLIFLGEQQ